MDFSISRLRKVLFCRKFWSNFDSNFPNDDIVHNRMFQMSRETFSQNIPHIPDFSSSISQIIRIFPEYLWHVSPGHPEQIVAFLSKSKFKSASKLFGKDTNWRSDRGRWKSIPSQFFLIYFLNFTFFGILRIGESMVVEKLLPFSFDLCQPQYFSRRRTSKAKYIRGWLPSYFQL